jgi:hypothetical protein
MRMDAQSDARHQSNSARVPITGTVSVATNSGRLAEPPIWAGDGGVVTRVASMCIWMICVRSSA